MAFLRRRFALLATCLLLFVLGSTFVIGCHPIRRDSMSPTLIGEGPRLDHVLVDLMCGTLWMPHRYDIIIFRQDGHNYVKRLIGLPGERLELRNGDVYIDGEIERKTIDQIDGMKIPVYPAEGEDDLGLWWRHDGGCEIAGSRASLAATEAVPATMWFTNIVMDHYPGLEEIPVTTTRERVRDLILSLDFRLRSPSAAAFAELGEQRDRFRAVIDAHDPEGATLDLEHDGKIVARTELVSIGTSSHRMRLFNVDNRVRVELDGKEILRFDYEANDMLDEASQHLGANSDSSPGANRAAFGVLRGRATFERVRLDRDIYYRTDSGLGSYTKYPRIEQDCYYVLGDNSPDSRDSRAFRSVAREAIIGRAIMICWPLDRIRFF